MRHERVVEIFAPRPGVEGKYGSGYQIGADLVLTARHVAGDIDATVQVRTLRGSQMFDAVVVWCGSGDIDAAIIRISDHAWDSASWTGEGLAWGTLVTGRASIACQAMGFPSAQRLEQGLRDTRHFSGRIESGSCVLGRRYQVNVSGATPLPGGNRSLWSGMSGAALFTDDPQLGDDLLLGIVVEDPLSYGSQAVQATRISDLWSDRAFQQLISEHRAVPPTLEAVGLTLMIDRPPRRFDVRSVGQLLRADIAAVDFHGRQEMLDEYVSWCKDGGFSVRLLTGQGGQGKTRFSMCLADRLAAQGWVVGHIKQVKDDLPTDAMFTTLSHLERPTLLIIDYAETRPNTVDQVLQRCALNTRASLRVLLIARSTGEWWERLRRSRHLGAGLAEVTPETLAPLDRSGSARQASYVHAVGCFARELKTVPGQQFVKWDAVARTVQPPELSSSEFDPILAIHMHALVALLQAGPGAVEIVPGAVTADLLLGHEKGYWDETAFARGLRPFEELLPRVVTVAALAGSPDEAAALALLARVQGLGATSEPDRLRLAAWYRDLYPAPEGKYWGPFLPDRLAEHLIGQTIGSLPALMDVVLPAPVAEQVTQAMVMLSRAAPAFPQLSHRLRQAATTLPVDDAVQIAYTAITVAPQVEHPRAMADYIDAVVCRTDLPANLVNDLLVSLPPTQTSQALAATTVLTLEKIIANVRSRPKLHKDSSDIYLAAMMDVLASALAFAGRYREAASVMSEQIPLMASTAAALDRDLTAVLVTAHTKHSAFHAYVPDPHGALDAAEKAVECGRQLSDSDDHRVLLTRALNAFARSLSDVGRFADALEVSNRAVGIWHGTDPLASLQTAAAFAGAADIHARLLQTAGRWDEARTWKATAVEIWRMLATADPQHHLRDFATSLASHSQVGFSLSDVADPLDTQNEQVLVSGIGTLEGLASVKPDYHLQDLAILRADYIRILHETGRPDTAMAHEQRSIEECRRLANANEGHVQLLIEALMTRLGRCFKAEAEKETLLPLAREAIPLLRRRIADGTSGQAVRLSLSLTIVADAQKEHGAHLEAVAAAQEAVSVIGDAEIATAIGQVTRARALDCLLQVVKACGVADDSQLRLEVAEQAVEQWREVRELEDTTATRSGLAGSLSALSDALGEVGRYSDATEPSAEAFAIWYELDGWPERLRFTQLPAITGILFDTIRFRMGETEIPIGPVARAADFLRPLAERDAQLFLPLLTPLVWLLFEEERKTGNADATLRLAYEGIDLQRRWPDDASALRKPHLAQANSDVAAHLVSAGAYEAAEPHMGCTVSLTRELAEADPDRHLTVSATALTNLFSLQKHLRHTESAASTMAELLSVLGRLTKHDLDSYDASFVRRLHKYAQQQLLEGNYTESELASQEAVAVSRILCINNPVYQPDLAVSQSLLATSALGQHHWDHVVALSPELIDLNRKLHAADESDAYTINLATGLANYSTALSNVERHAEALAASKEAIELATFLHRAQYQHLELLLQTLLIGSTIAVSARQWERAISLLGQLKTWGADADDTMQRGWEVLARAYELAPAEVDAALRSAASEGLSASGDDQH